MFSWSSSRIVVGTKDAKSFATISGSIPFFLASGRHRDGTPVTWSQQRGGAYGRGRSASNLGQVSANSDE